MSIKRDQVQYKRALAQNKRDLAKYKRDLLQYKRDLLLNRAGVDPEIVALGARRDDAHVEHFRSRLVFIRLGNDELTKSRNSQNSVPMYIYYVKLYPVGM